MGRRVSVFFIPLPHIPLPFMPLPFLRFTSSLWLRLPRWVFALKPYCMVPAKAGLQQIFL
jgi:hypothetical protein